MSKYRLIASASVTLAIVAAVGPQLFGASGNNNDNYITLQKVLQFDQTSGSGPFADPISPFAFNVASPVAMSFTPPGGSSTALTLSSGSNNDKYKFGQGFGTQSAMDAAYPNGSYTFAVSGSSNFSLSLTGNLYPNTPQVTGGTWNSSGQLVIDSTQNNTLNFNTFSTYGTSGVLSHMQIQIMSFDSSTVNLTQSYLTPTNASAFTSYSIPAGTLTPGSVFYCQLEFDIVPSDNATAVSGDTVVTLYSMQTSFILVTSGTPSNVPTITQQPTNVTSPLGSNVAFQVSFSGGNNVQVQWFKNGVPLGLNNNNNEGGPTLNLNNIQNSDAASYFAVLTFGTGPYVQTNAVTLTIGSAASNPPSFTVQPVSQVVATGGAVAFNASASNSPSYLWSLNGSPVSNGNGISGANSSTLTISSASSANAGSYTCTATNSFGTVQSNSAGLSVTNTTNIGRLINIATRALVGTGGNILIPGFVIGGSGTETLLIRADGPSLTAFGVPGALAAPSLILTSQATGATLATNTGWGTNSNPAQIASVAAQVGAFALASGSADCAVIVTLQPGAYTVQVSGVGNTTGVALAEVYEVSYTGTARLVNIATRAVVGTGGNILIPGFVIGGSTSETLLIRASGPALAAFGVPGTLPDPNLTLYSGSTVLGSNDGWGGNAQIVSTASLVGAFAWGNPSSNDSAILVTLPPGPYTAQVAGASGDTGVGLIEVYEVP